MNKAKKVCVCVLLLVFTLFIPIININTNAEGIQNDMSFYDFNIKAYVSGDDMPNDVEFFNETPLNIAKSGGQWALTLDKLSYNDDYENMCLRYVITTNRPFIVNTNTNLSFNFGHWNYLDFNFENARLYLGNDISYNDYISFGEASSGYDSIYYNQFLNIRNLKNDTWTLNNDNNNIASFNTILILLNVGIDDNNNNRLNTLNLIIDNAYNTFINNNNALQNELNLTRDENSNLRNEINDLKLENQNLQNIINQLNSNISSMQNTINYLNEQIKLYNENGGYRFDNLFWSIASVPFGVLVSTFNVDVLGFNIGSIITGTITAFLLIWLLKKFMR